MPRLLLCLALLASLATAQSADRSKTLIIGFDGMDHGLTARFMEAGQLPNLARLAAEGTFQRLETSNPAQSPVSWAVFNTGQNPGKTGVGGFVSRYFGRDEAGQRKGTPLPQPMLGFATEVPADDLVEYALAVENPMAFTGLVAGLGLLAGLVLFKLLLRRGFALSLLAGLVLAGGGGYLAMDYTAGLPAGGTVPYEINPMQGTNFWKYLDDNQVRLWGIQVASTFPPDTEGDSTHLLSGLGVKDISGSPGSWFVYTDDPWSWEKSTNTAGKVIKIYFDLEDGTKAQGELLGPRNWFIQGRFDQQLEALEAQLTNPENSEQEAARLEAEKQDLQSERTKFMSDAAVKVPFYVSADRAAGKATVEVGGSTVELSVGEWSGFLPVTFPHSERFASHGVVRFHLLRCDEEDVRLFVPPINIDPSHPPEWLPISSPAEFSAEIAAGIGSAYETLGWACMTNPLKDRADSQFEAQSFMDDIVSTMNLREQILDWGLSNADAWDVYYQVFSTTDRVCHLLMREYDPDHPEHDPDYAATQVSAWGRSFPLSDAVPEVYKEADRIVGDILGRMEAGEFGDDPLLMLVADHGFTSFRRGVNLNNLLWELGFLKTKGDKAPGEIGGDFLSFVDWERTQAYSLGLGKVFINLVDREPEGIVAPEEYDAVVDAICAALEGVTDGPGGPKVVTSASRRDELFSGPWFREGTTTRLVKGVEESVDHDGFADIFLGYAPYYRVSWANTMGGLDSASITNNTNHWSGGHVSVDPEHVAGIFFSNRKLDEPARSGLIDIGPTVIQRYGIDPAGTTMDGRALPLQDLQR